MLLTPLFYTAAENPEEKLEKQRRLISDESDSELVRMNIYDSDVSLLMSGFWKGALLLNWGISSGPLGVAPDSSDSPLLFTQEVDITLSLWLRKKWFLEVSFLDDYHFNTYRAGYRGLPGETVQYAGVGNTGLDFPLFPYLDLGGDSSSSFGAYGRFGSGNTSFHALVRYDGAVREERSFLGDRERTFSGLSPEKILRGVSFILPDKNIPVPAVYFEDRNGSLSGSDGRRWRLAKPSEYAASGVQGIVELAREAPGMVAVSYGNGAWNTSMGNYNGTGFLRTVQNIFDPGRTTIKLEDYPQPGQRTAGANIPGTASINGVPALVIYEPGTFSPFERQSRYRAPLSSSSDAALVRASSGEHIPGFQMLPSDGLSLDIPLYTLNGVSGRDIFELVSGDSLGIRGDPESLWPLVSDYPELYLPGKQSFTGDLSIRFTNYGPAGAYTIGTDAVPGSVQVYRSGIIDARIHYDAGSGVVRLESPAGFNELIKITYLKRGEERRFGSIAAGAGMVYTSEDSPFSAEAALGLRWNVSPEAYTENGAASPGTAGFGGRVSWDYPRLKTSVSLGFGFEQPDTTGLYRIAGMEGNSEIVMSLSVSRAFISEAPPVKSVLFPDLYPDTRADLAYRNYRNSDIFGVSRLMPIDWSAPLVSGKQGPYPASDADMEVFAAEFDLDAYNTGKFWTGFQVPLGEDGKLLEKAKAVVIPLRCYDFSPANTTIAVQFGTLNGDGAAGSENAALIVERKLDPLLSGWTNNQDVTVTLSDADRRKLQNASSMRIIIINTSGAPLSGRLLAAKPYIMGASWRGITLDAGKIILAEDPAVSLTETRDASLKHGEIDRLHPSGANHVLRVDWTTPASAGADGRTGIIPLSQYRLVSFFLKPPHDPSGTPVGFNEFHFIIRGINGRTVLEAAVPKNEFGASTDWVKMELRYGGGERKIYINGKQISGASFSYNPGALTMDDSGSAYIAVYADSLISGGSFSIDEICLEEGAPSYRINTGTTLAWNHPETIVSLNNTSVLSRFSVDTALETGASGDPFTPESDNFAAAQSRSSASVNILGANLGGNLSFYVSNGDSWFSGGHSLSRSFGPFSISERFDAAPADKTFEHALAAALGTPLYVRVSSNIRYDGIRFDGYQDSGILKRGWDFLFGLDAVQNTHPGFFLGANLVYGEKTGRMEGLFSNYAETWVMSFPEMLVDSGRISTGIQNRDIHGRAGFRLNHIPVGLNLSLDGGSSVSVPANMTQTVSKAALELPFVLGGFRGNLTGERHYRRGGAYTNIDTAKDIAHYGESLSDSLPLWLSVPVYSIFDPNLEDRLDAAVTNYRIAAANTRWTEALSLNLLFPERYDPFSLVIPARFSSRVDRTLEQRLETRLDVLSVNSTIGFSGINLFGSMGNIPVFMFYRNDEFSHSVSGLASFPGNEDPVWKIQAEQNLNFFGFRGAELYLGNTLTIASTGWIESAALIWTVPSEKTLLSLIYGKIMNVMKNRAMFPAFSSLAENGHERLRRESFELILDKSGDYARYSFIIGHESLVRITGKLNLSAFAKLAVNKNNYNDALSFMLNMGSSLTVTF